jgi:hypothetical protein
MVPEDRRRKAGGGRRVSSIRQERRLGCQGMDAGICSIRLTPRACFFSAMERAGKKIITRDANSDRPGRRP